MEEKKVEKPIENNLPGTSEKIDKIAAALAKAQSEIFGAEKNSSNPHFKSGYANLAAIIAACRDKLTSNGIAVIQRPISVSAGIALETILAHSSGQYIAGLMRLPSERSNAQGHGSAYTYACRYSLAAMVGIPTVDDDGNEASKAKNGKPVRENLNDIPKKPKKEEKTDNRTAEEKAIDETIQKNADLVEYIRGQVQGQVLTYPQARKIAVDSEFDLDKIKDTVGAFFQ